ncbi:MAG: sensor domain-containing diguanylate cyclase [Clostridium lundense]|nr:sensor domain-containing diguanylate cyclase [Clostridium lundense]
MDYNSLSKEQLIEAINELQMLNRQLLEEKEQEIGLNFSWTGNLGHWYWNIKTNTVVFNSLKVTTLGYCKDEIPEKVTYQFFTEKLHPEDYQKTMDAMMNHLKGITSVYEVEYRIRTKDNKYKWYYDRGKITQYDERGKPIFLAGIVFDITEKKEMQLDLEVKNSMLTELASTDGLTKVKNHKTLIDHLTLEVNNALKSREPLSIAMFDIDNFKKINDSKGHIYGDTVLIKIAEIMKNNIRDTDIVGRYGGEEFMIVLSKANESIVRSISERIRQAIEQQYMNNDIKVTISGGIKEYAGESLTEFIHAADVNLYEAKSKGKNKII